jgi:hypothetical protein
MNVGVVLSPNSISDHSNSSVIALERTSVYQIYTTKARLLTRNDSVGDDGGTRGAEDDN